MNAADAPNPVPGQPSAEEHERNKQIGKLLTHCFHKLFCVSDNVPQEMKSKVFPVYFYGWLDQALSRIFAAGEVVNLCTDAGVEPASFYALRTILDGGMAVERLAILWWHVVLADRPQQHGIARVSVTALIEYDDGRILPLNAVVTKEMVDGGKLTDGYVASIITRNGHIFAGNVAEAGLDALHTRTDDFRGDKTVLPEDPFNVFMGLLILGHKQVAEIYKPTVMNYIRLVQGMIRLPVKVARPSIPAVAGQQSEPQPITKRGGWDL